MQILKNVYSQATDSFSGIYGRMLIRAARAINLKVGFAATKAPQIIMLKPLPHFY